MGRYWRGPHRRRRADGTYQMVEGHYVTSSTSSQVRVSDGGASEAVADDMPFGANQRQFDPSPLTQHPSLTTIIERFRQQGIPLHVVGGPVRDLIAEGHPGNDLDMTSPADVELVKTLVDDLGAVPDAGQEFGTVRLCREDHPDVEITQWRAEKYRDDSRKPETVVADSLEQDLARRDFTVNAMAVNCTTGELVDPYGGRADLQAGVLRPPGDPDMIFSEDPLRTVRMVRFAATRGWTPTDETVAAARRQAGRLHVAAAERRLVELSKTFRHPRREAFRDLLENADRAGVTDVLFAGLDTREVRQWDLESVPPSARLATLVFATGRSESADALKRLKVDNGTAQYATSVADAARRSSATVDEVEARHLVRTSDDMVLDDAAAVVSASGGRVSSAVVDARERSGVWRQPLPVNGHDAMSLGLKGRDVGTWLKRVEGEFLARPDGFSRERALSVSLR